MPLNITATGRENINDETNAHFYSLAVMMMAAGVPVLKNDDDRALFLARVSALGLLPEDRTVAEFMAWVDSFGNVTTNAPKRTWANVLKTIRENAESDAYRVMRKIRQG